MPRRLALAALPLVLIVALLSACTESTRIPTAEPPSATQPLFASDEEALEAATAAYEEYLAVLDSLLQNPQPVTSEFDGIAEEGALDAAKESVQQFVDEGVSISGPRKIGSAELQQVVDSDGSVEVFAYFCEDVTGVELTDIAGNSLTRDERPEHTLFEARIVFEGQNSVVVGRQFWSNETSC